LSSSSPLTMLLIAWAIVTGVYFVLVFLRSMIGMRQEDTIYLSAAEAKMEQEQQAIRNKMNRIAPFTRGFGWGSLGLLIVMGGMWAFDMAKELMK
jgi:hypothetical protein